LDWKINDKNSFNVSYNRLRWDSPAGIQTQPFNTRGRTAFGNDFVKGETVIAKLDSFISNNLSNQFRYQYGRDFEFENSQIPAANEPTSFHGLPPQATIGGGNSDGSCGGSLCIGTPEFLQRAALPDEKRNQFTDSITWIHGRHTIKTGFDINHVSDAISNLRFEAGSFNYNTEVDFISDYLNSAGGCVSTGAAGTPPAGTRIGCYTRFTQAFGPTAFTFSTNDYSFFIQDDLKVSPRLTVNLGLRYEYEQLPAPQLPNPLWSPTQEFPHDRNNLGPRIGIAWQPFADGKTVVRGGYGMYYGRIINATIFTALTSTGLTTGQTSYQFTPTQAAAPIYPALLTGAPTTAAKPNVFGFDSRFQNPKIHQADVIIEREVGWNTVVSASYLLSIGTHLPNGIDTNLPNPTTLNYPVFGGPLDGATITTPFFTGARPDTNFTNKTLIVSRSNSNYNALVLQANHRMSHHVQFMTNYTWSHALDQNQNTGTNPPTNGYLDPNNPALEYGNSAFDYRHKFVSSVIWQPVAPSDNKIVKGILDGFTLSPIISISSGSHYSAGVSGNPANATSTGITGSAGLGSRIPTMRNAFTQPKTWTVDMRVSRRFTLLDKYKFEALVEAFNLFNHQNITNVSTTEYSIGTTSAANPTPTVCANEPKFTPGVLPVGTNVLCAGTNSFGAVTCTNGNTIFRERQVQIGLRFEF
jgi:hypothetical protein